MHQKNVIGDLATCLEIIEPRIRQRIISLYGYVNRICLRKTTHDGPHWEFTMVVPVIRTKSDPVYAACPRTFWAEQLRKDASGMEHWEF